jgi:hypothetical protein
MPGNVAHFASVQTCNLKQSHEFLAWGAAHVTSPQKVPSLKEVMAEESNRREDTKDEALQAALRAR